MVQSPVLEWFELVRDGGHLYIDDMSERLPPLNALRAFDAAARHLSFSKAAAELHVTHGAVSRHIANLEDALGVRLFERGSRQLTLTPVAQRYWISVNNAFETLRHATCAVISAPATETIKLRALQSFVSRWLIPRLPGPPDLNLQLSLSSVALPIDHKREGVDISIEAGVSNRPATVSFKLLDVNLAVVCSPHGAEGQGIPKNVEELVNYTLIAPVPIPDLGYDLWQAWSEEVGISLDNAAVIQLPTFDMVLNAAAEGIGIGICPDCFVEREIADGTLVAPFDVVVQWTMPYSIVIPSDKLGVPKVRILIDWLLRQSGQPGLDNARNANITSRLGGVGKFDQT